MGIVRSAARATKSGSSNLATPEKWVVDWFKGGEATNAGVHVSPETALTYGPFFNGVRVLSEDVASLPLFTYERLERGKRRAPEHPLYGLLHDSPNPLMTAAMLREILQAQALTWGTGYAEIVRERGTVVELWPLRPDRIKPEVVHQGPGRRLVRWQYRDQVNNIEATFLPDEILTVMGPSADGVSGRSIVALARNAIGLGLATEIYGSSFFKNGSRPSGVLESPDAVSDEARKRIKSDWESLHKGLDRAQRVAILEEGVTWQQMGIPPEDAQFLETRKFQVADMARWLRLPPHKLGDLERSTFSNIEHQALDYVVSSLRPWLVRWEQMIALRLLNSEERGRFFVEHLVDGLLRGDIKARYEAHSISRQWGWHSGNDIREIENENPVEGLDDYLVPLNMVPAGQAGSEEGPRHASRSLRSVEGRRRVGEAFKPLIIDLDGRMAKLEHAEVSSLVRRHLEDRSESRGRSVVAFQADLEELYRGRINERAEERWLPLMTTFADEVASVAALDVGVDEVPDLSRWTGAYVSTHVRYRVDSALGQLTKLLGEDDPAEAIRGRLDDWVEARPERTARWESNQMVNAASRETWRSSGVRQMRWMAFGAENCPACRSLDGITVSIESPFAEGGSAVEQIDVPRTTFHPPLHAGCDCSLVPA